jgi:hypothetical protein
LTQAKVLGIVLRAAWHWGDDSSAANNLLGALGSTSLYLCLPSIGALWVVTIIAPLLVGLLWRKHKIKPIKSRDTVVEKYHLVLLKRGPASLENPLRELVFQADLGMLSI